MDPYTLLVIARTQFLTKRLRSALNAEQYLIRWVPNASQALQLELEPSLVILNLPPSGGSRSVARLKRQFDAPLLALARSSQSAPDLVDAFQPGPFDLKRCVAEIETLLIDHSAHMIRAEGMSLDTKARRLQMNGTLHQLRPTGCQILAILMAQPGRVIPRSELCRKLWQHDDGDNTRTLDVHIAYLRRVLEADPRRPKLIITERGIGYGLHPPG